MSTLKVLGVLIDSPPRFPPAEVREAEEELALVTLWQRLAVEPSLHYS